MSLSDERIVWIESNNVVLRVRTYPTSGKKRAQRIPGTEFIGRFLRYVLPSDFKRTRHYGLVSPARKKRGLALARAAFDMPPPQPAVIE